MATKYPYFECGFCHYPLEEGVVSLEEPSICPHCEACLLLTRKSDVRQIRAAIKNAFSLRPQKKKPATFRLYIQAAPSGKVLVLATAWEDGDLLTTAQVARIRRVRIGQVHQHIARNEYQNPRRGKQAGQTTRWLIPRKAVLRALYRTNRRRSADEKDD